MKIKCGDVVFLPYVQETHFAEVGPGKCRGNYEVFPLVPENQCFVYGEACWIPKKAIAEHHVVRTTEDFHRAWISLGFQPIVSEKEVRFQKLFDHEHVVDSDCVDSLSSTSEPESESVVSIRSNDSWSTMEDSDTDSFVTDDDQESEHQCQETNCPVCQERRDTEHWFRRQWHPADPTETAVKNIIEQIEEKYT